MGKYWKVLSLLVAILCILGVDEAKAIAGPTLYTPANGATDLSQPISFSWSSIPEDVIANNIVIDDDPGFGSPIINQEVGSNPSFSTSSLQDGVQYYWRVRVQYRKFGFPFWTDWSETWSFTTECPPIDAPDLISPTSGATEQILPLSFSWSPPAGSPTQYEIQIDDNSDFSTPTFDINVGNTYVEILSGLDYGFPYYWRVRAEDNCGWGTWSSPWTFSMVCPIPDIPTLSSPANDAVDLSQPILLDWSDVSLVDDYRIMIDDDPFFGSPELDYTFAVGLSEYSASGLDNGTFYYWKVMASNICGDNGWSEIWRFKIGGSSSLCGDVNLDDLVNILDIVYLINFKYKEGPDPCDPPPPPEPYK